NHNFAAHGLPSPFFVGPQSDDLLPSLNHNLAESPFLNHKLAAGTGWRKLVSRTDDPFSHTDISTLAVRRIARTGSSPCLHSPLDSFRINQFPAERQRYR